MGIQAIADKLSGSYKTSIKGNSIIISTGEVDFKELYKIKEKIKNTIISGVKGISQVLIVNRAGNYIIFTSGSNLKEIVNVKGINKNKTMTNDLYETEEIFGIEVARQLIINEIEKVINSQGLDINKRHLKLVADAMTVNGEVHGMTRMGIIARKSSILARASFETPIKHFINATIKASKDELLSVIENIILNQPVPIGTGLPGLMVKITGPLA